MALSTEPYDPTFSGQVALSYNKDTRVFKLTRNAAGKYDSSPAGIVALLVAIDLKEKAVMEKFKLPCTFDKWSFYIKGLNQKLEKNEGLSSLQFSEAVIAGAGMKTEDAYQIVVSGKWGQPKLIMRSQNLPAGEKVKKESNIEIL